MIPEHDDGTTGIEDGSIDEEADDEDANDATSSVSEKVTLGEEDWVAAGACVAGGALRPSLQVSSSRGVNRRNVAIPLDQA